MAAIVIADDLTGACDAGALFAGRGRVAVLTDPAAATRDGEVVVVDTESRALPAAEARERVRMAAQRLGAPWSRALLFKKIDSTLRGPVGAELDELLSASGRRTALVCSALPGQHRTIAHGILRVGGVPAHESPVGQDPAYPRGTSDVAGILERDSHRRVAPLSLAQVRGEHDALIRRLAGIQDRIVAADAETDADLDALARAAAALPEFVVAGSAGLARAVAGPLGYAGPRVPLPEGRAWLIVAGSLHPVTRAQIRSLQTAGVMGASIDGALDPQVLIGRLRDGHPVFITTDESVAPGPDARRHVASRLAHAASQVLQESRPDLVVVTGGDTAHALLRALGAARLDLLGAPSVGLALADVVVNGKSAVLLLTKAGGFGAPDLFVSLLEGKA